MIDFEGAIDDACFDFQTQMGQEVLFASERDWLGEWDEPTFRCYWVW